MSMAPNTITAVMVSQVYYCPCRDEGRKLPGMSTYENYPGEGTLLRCISAPVIHCEAFFHYGQGRQRSLPLHFTPRAYRLIARSRSLDHKTTSEREPSQNQHLHKNTRGWGVFCYLQIAACRPTSGRAKTCFHPVPARRYANPICAHLEVTDETPHADFYRFFILGRNRRG